MVPRRAAHGTSAARDAQNQFGKFEIRTGTGYGILVPTQKVETGSVFPKTLDHYKVYRLADVEQVPEKTLKLKDQFGTSEARLRIPLTSRCR